MAIADKPRMLVGGEWVDAARTRTIHDPATGAPIAEVAEGTAALSGAPRKPWYDAVSTPEEA